MRVCLCVSLKFGRFHFSKYFVEQKQIKAENTMVTNICRYIQQLCTIEFLDQF